MNENNKSLLAETLRFLAPGTVFREGLDNVVGAKTGALIVVGYDEKVEELIDGGFYINCPFSAAYLYELAKMDGAIILNETGDRILYANTQLVPKSAIASTETGIRHRTAQRTAQQTGKIVVSISQRRNVITIYQGSIRYALKDIRVILTKANQAIQTLEKYKSVLDQSMTNLSALEFEGLVNLHEVAFIMQRIEMVLRIKREIQSYINELGTEGRLIRMQLEELVDRIEVELFYLAKDYALDAKSINNKTILEALQQLQSDDLMDLSHFIKILGYSDPEKCKEEYVSPRGYRILNKISRIPVSVLHRVIARFERLPSIMIATIEDLDEVDGVGEVRAQMIKDGLLRIQEQVLLDRNV